jgi:uncharacterized protein (TIGR00725 family)
VRRTTIGVIGNASRPGVELPAALLETATEVGRHVAEAGAVLITGGTGGVMEAASKGAHEAGGLSIGFLPQADLSHANPYLDVALPTGMGTLRNVLTARCCDALVMVGGGVGTLNELTIAYDVGTPVVAIRGTGGWSDRIVRSLVDGRWLDERRVAELELADDPRSAVARALEATTRPRRTGGLTAHAGHAGA